MGKLTVGMTDEWFKREGMEREPQPWEDGSRVDNLPGRFEWWYFDAHFDNGYSVVAGIFSKPYSNVNLPCSPQVKLSITEPGGATLLDVDDFKGADFKASKDTCDVSVGKNTIKGDLKTYEIHFEVKGKKVDLKFERIVPSWRQGVGKCYFGEDLHDYFGWMVPIPHGRVSGTIEYGGKKVEVTGSGYHDHNYGNIALPKVIDHWYWGRLKIGDFSCIFFQFVATKKYGSEKLPLFMFAKGDVLLTGDGSKLTVRQEDMKTHASGKKYPGKLIFNWKDGDDTIDIMLTNPVVIDARNLLANFSWLKRTIARLIVNPYYFRFNADTEINIKFKGMKESKKDKTIFESMMLK